MMGEGCSRTGHPDWKVLTADGAYKGPILHSSRALQAAKSRAGLCRLHTLLAAERGFARCTGAATEAEAAAMTGAMENAFLALDREILDRARREGGRDGCCALVAVRVGAHQLPRTGPHRCLCSGMVSEVQRLDGLTGTRASCAVCGSAMRLCGGRVPWAVQL